MTSSYLNCAVFLGTENATFSHTKNWYYLRNFAQKTGLHKWNKCNKTSEQYALNIVPSKFFYLASCRIEWAESMCRFSLGRRKCWSERKSDRYLESCTFVFFAYTAKLFTLKVNFLNSIGGTYRVSIAIEVLVNWSLNEYIIRKSPTMENDEHFCA